MDTLLAKKLPGGMRKEIIIVESNSKDGTREQVLKYQDLPDVKVILQDQPRGKGNAVRAGFEQASGDICLIQDADLEYDLNDLDILLEPIMRYRSPFVLGSRHGGQWKMRQFNEEQGLSTFFNFGHLLFTGLLNLMYGQHLKDPFTMYKVFRRDCLHGLLFEANRFDFDFELVIKLVRKGYKPLEIPINYRSRSFKEGKKVQIFRDPLTWIWALVKYRFAEIYKQDYLQ
jgi:glycosyltransferase involved in cell wall biosynthesis